MSGSRSAAQSRSRSGRTPLLAVAGMLLVSACTVSVGGQAVRGSGADPGASSVQPTVTVTADRTVAAGPGALYVTAPSVRRVTPANLSGLGWWSAAVNTNGSSSLTTDGSHDDSATIYIEPSSPVQPKNTASRVDSPAGDRWPGVGLSGRTNGQLIGISGEHAYTCSGTVVHSAAQNMVLTAGHCVWNIPVGKSASAGGAAMTLLDTIWFVPGASELTQPLTLDSEGLPGVQAPDGIWKVVGAYTNDRWRSNTWITQSGRGLQQSELMHGAGSYDDIAFLTLQPLDGRQIESVTGAQGLMFSNTATSARQIAYPTVVLGYPSAAPFDGSGQRFCAQRLPDTYQGDSLVQTARVSCSMTPGSSGGAWFTGFDGVDGVGYVYGVTSRGGNSKLTAGMLSLADDYPLYRKLAG